MNIVITQKRKCFEHTQDERKQFCTILVLIKYIPQNIMHINVHCILSTPYWVNMFIERVLMFLVQSYNLKCISKIRKVTSRKELVRANTQLIIQQNCFFHVKSNLLFGRTKNPFSLVRNLFDQKEKPWKWRW